MSYREEIKKHYASLSDLQIEAFANNNANELTPEAKTLLSEELLKRGLISNKIEQTEEVEEETKKEAVTNIFEFEQLINSKLSSAYKLAVVNSVLLYGIPIVIIVFGFLLELVLAIIIGVLAGVFFIYFQQKKLKGALKGSEYWLDLMRYNNEEIVWIKPIVVKHTVYYVVTLLKEKQFQLVKDNLVITFTCNNDGERQIFFEGIIKYLPHAHIGYSGDVAIIFDESPETFLHQLKRNKLYYPVSRLGM